ncbi:MAG: cytochrome c3 family protein [Acidobacteria bacterium]|nr:cytochrome c3 family protein [Acidobacteriota bacterium]
MSAIFPKSTDLYVRIGGAVAVLAILGGVGSFAYLSHPKVLETGYSPVQPVPYSHKLHAGNLGMDCRYCHSTVERAAFAAIPPAETCMNCHHKVKEKNPILQPVRDSFEKGVAMKWVKVHRLPDYVYFNHQAHVGAGVSCVSCHGRVDQMIEVKQVAPLSMAWCLECHRNPAANLRPAHLVTRLDWKPEGDPAEIGRRIIEEKHIKPPTNCSGCHR